MNGVIVWQTRNYKLSQALGSILIVLFCGRERWSRRHWARSKCLGRTIGERWFSKVMMMYHWINHELRQKYENKNKQRICWRRAYQNSLPSHFLKLLALARFHQSGEGATPRLTFAWAVRYLWHRLLILRYECVFSLYLTNLKVPENTKNLTSPEELPGMAEVGI